MVATLRREFQLTNRTRRPVETAPSLAKTIAYFMSLPTWTDRTIANMERAIEHYWDCDERDDEAEDQIGLVESAIKEWKRIETAPMFPSTAWAMRHSRIEDRNERAVKLWRKIQDAGTTRRKQLESKMRTFKTYKAQQNERRRVHGADKEMRRLERYDAMLRRYVPNVAYMAQVWASRYAN
jgi:hypothetical protein